KPARSREKAKAETEAAPKLAAGAAGRKKRPAVAAQTAPDKAASNGTSSADGHQPARTAARKAGATGAAGAEVKPRAKENPAGGSVTRARKKVAVGEASTKEPRTPDHARRNFRIGHITRTG